VMPSTRPRIKACHQFMVTGSATAARFSTSAAV
jgi:hypothetical protein